ncbi:glycosyltransferase family 2 protein [Roseibium album]|uniref:glycosyltransferase family 2 protein n=1 Tax=Roseibium album TaxID=311410 RepID=UPI002490E4C4|nr:glycosyltransferase family 2 protein [Roseibium album]
MNAQTSPNSESIAPKRNRDSAELTVIIVSYNTRELTVKALETLYATTHETAFHAVVYDNASEDGSAEAIRKQFPQATLIDASENIGFAAANNEVAKIAATEWLLLLNPDTECHAGAVDELLKFGMAHPESGIYGGRTVYPDGSLNIGSCWNQMTPWSLLCSALGLSALLPESAIFNSEALGGWKRDTVRNVDIVVGCFFLIRRALWNELNGFDRRYFMYGEEADLCLRARKMGYHPMITPDAQIMHLLGAASPNKSRKLIQLQKAKVTLIEDHWSAVLHPVGRALLRLWAANRLVASHVLRFLARGSGSKKAEERLSLWREVWHARKDWLKGYNVSS